MNLLPSVKKRVSRSPLKTAPNLGANLEETTNSDTVAPNKDKDFSVEKTQKGDELDGNLSSEPDKERLAHTVLDADDTDKIDEGMLVDEALNQNLSAFLPDMMFKDMVTNYKNAKKLYGETIIRELSGYDPRFIDKNVRIPEFQRELQKKLKDSFDKLAEQGLISSKGHFSPDALDAAALFLIKEEFNLHPNTYSSFGEPVPKASDQGGERTDFRPFKKRDPYRDVAIKQSIARALKRGHTSLRPEDIMAYDREARQQINIIYALDTSGSMKGKKLGIAKKAGVSLAHKAMRDQNKAGLVIFETDVKTKVPLTKDLFTFTRPLARITPGKETDIAVAIKESVKLLEDTKGIKHIVLLTDGLHTTSADPKNAVLTEVAKAKEQDITISVVGIGLDELGSDLAKHIVDVSKGRLYAVKDLDDMGGIVIADYESLQ